MASWSLLTKHARVLLCIARNPNVRLRDIAAALEITERSAYSIVGDLADEGYVTKEKEGRRNRYVVQRHLVLPEPTIEERSVGEMIDVFLETKARPRRTA
jgi:sugar-specific transcriptional regulator TrmB